MYHKLLKHNAQDPTGRIRYKLQRFDQLRIPMGISASANQATPAWQARRALANLQLLGKLTPPRIGSAVFGTLWNRWWTHRRRQQRACDSNKCYLGCESAEDSIAHYCCCKVTRTLLQRHCNLSSEKFANLHSFLQCNPHVQTTEQLTLISIVIYAIYNTTNHLRRHPSNDHKFIHDFAVQKMTEGVKRHSRATRTLDNTFNPLRTRSPLPAIPPHI